MSFLSVLTSAWSSVVKVIDTTIQIAIKGIKELGNLFMHLGKALGLFDKQTKIDELGDKALQSEYTPEDFKSYEDYVNAVEKFDELDSEKSQKISEEEKIREGMKLVLCFAVEKFKDFPVTELFNGMLENPEFFTADKMDEIGKLIASDNQYISDLVKYMDGSEKDELKIENTMDMLINIEKSVNPELSNVEAFRNVAGIRRID